MLTNTNLFLKLTRRVNESTGNIELYPRVICEDGFEVSIQASKTHYCSPRTNEEVNYEKLELGFPNEKDDLIIEYAEDEDCTDTIYGYVPVEVVDKLLEKHGGIVDIVILD